MEISIYDNFGISDPKRGSILGMLCPFTLDHTYYVSLVRTKLYAPVGLHKGRQKPKKQACGENFQAYSCCLVRGHLLLFDLAYFGLGVKTV